MRIVFSTINQGSPKPTYTLTIGDLSVTHQISSYAPSTDTLYFLAYMAKAMLHLVTMNACTAPRYRLVLMGSMGMFSSMEMEM